MSKDKYSAVWVSHSSLGDFIKCPRAYYLNNVYKDPESGRKISLVNPHLSLGFAVHEALEGLARFRTEERFTKGAKRRTYEKYDEAWSTISGELGGFSNSSEEKKTKERGLDMIERVLLSPGPLENKTVKLPDSGSGMPPNFFLSEKENIILCGKIDWLEYVEGDDCLRILDFKTGKNSEKEDSLQLPIYQLLLNALQKRKICGAYYWYIDKDDEPISVKLPEVNESRERVLKEALKVKKAREENIFKCPKGGCFACKPFEEIISGSAKFVGVGGYNQDLYMLK